MCSEVTPIIEVVCEGYPVDFVTKFADFRKLGRFTDVTLRVAGEEMVAHRAVLSAASPVFNAMFDDAFAETKKEVVDLHHETTPKVMAAILDYVYSGKLKMNVEYFTLFLRNADYFGLEGLKNELPKALSTRLNANNCISTLVLAVENGLDDLMNKAKQILVSHYQSINTSKEIQMLTKKQLELILNLVQQSPATQKYAAIMHWIKYDELNRQDYMYDLASKYVNKM
ncbi:unnamed protein product [Hermetia illucens]|uniref:BTB domain-containing protein n=1 Tax=Hermetia illucens TaxID=343691 RepID=A0A7R8UFH0_HERIL|nr:kelch-like protein 12 isoform X1 [Hermetia illucens]XP_037919550.1 kelch-like protein 12 isoform X1 [Hermetia illucens]CAD7079862.1 unnamed protein product [Hermetia illucens]